MNEWTWSVRPVWWMWGAGGLVMLLTMLVVWGLVIAGLVVAVRWLFRQGPPTPRGAALEILRERYARGEIDREEFEQKRRDLGV